MNKVVPRLIGAAIAVAALSSVLVSRATAPAGHYTIANGTVYDTKTKLTWQQTAPTTGYIFSAAQTYCSTLVLNGGGWRLPTSKELMTIVDFSVAPPGPTIDQTAFLGLLMVNLGNSFWTTTSEAGAPGNVAFIDFSQGYLAYTPLSGGANSFTRCVR